MKQQFFFVSCLIITICLTTSGCGDQLYLENAATPLALGLDLDKNEKLHFYSSAPVFSKNIKKKSQETSGRVESLRQSKGVQDAQSSGSLQGRNYQVILLGRHFLSYEDWIPLLDVLFRDARNTVTDRVIAVDGSVEDVFLLNPPDQPLLPILLRGMVDTKAVKSETYATTAQEFHRQFYDMGITPYIAEVKIVNKQVRLKGSALLNQRGKYVLSLGSQETILLSILQEQAAPGFSLTYQIPDEPVHGPFQTNILSLTGAKVKTKIKTAYKNNKFKFDIHIKTRVGLSEHLFPFNVEKNDKELEKQVEILIKDQILAIIGKLQKNKIDPIGLGVYARAHEYEEFCKVEDQWGEAFSNAEVNVKVDIEINSMGPIK
ncbi:Ger(x)C family spore germination protein [Bacillus sp. FJAT-28004]|uniref:Ger(x)C family spore germination protein n=1 Tax=Bacillus sp. FJAT-28004 TaxID=1679165 RepID=UPI0006B629B4|nr:Ger(x)C family spore germination protein [Bacillus sp. FJAT-28004]